VPDWSVAARTPQPVGPGRIGGGQVGSAERSQVDPTAGPRAHFSVPVWYSLLIPKHSAQRKSPDFRAFLSSGGGIRTRHLRGMSPTSYQTAPPRGGLRIVAPVRGADGFQRRRRPRSGAPRRLPYVIPYVRAKDKRLLDGAGVEATR